MARSHQLTATVKPISFREILQAPNGVALMAEYAAECSLQEIGKIRPQETLYEAMERSGAFQCFGVFAGDVLAGFGCVLVYVVPHYGRKIATVESLFVARAHRAWGAGSALMREIEAHARREGCVAVLYSAPAGGRLERLLKLSKSYRHSNTVFLRAL